MTILTQAMMVQTVSWQEMGENLFLCQRQFIWLFFSIDL